MIDIAVQKALRDYTLEVTIRMPASGTLVLLGENGAGKSTVLNLVAGLMTPDAGHIRIGGETLTDTASRTCIPAELRGMGYVFQDYALFPHMTVYDNIAYGLRIRHIPCDEADARVRELAGQLGMLPVCDEKVERLSGGQRQRVALAPGACRPAEMPPARRAVLFARCPDERTGAAGAREDNSEREDPGHHGHPRPPGRCCPWRQDLPDGTGQDRPLRGC